jgi:hypothetical protein
MLAFQERQKLPVISALLSYRRMVDEIINPNSDIIRFIPTILYG